MPIDFPEIHERFDTRITTLEARVTEIEKTGAVEDVHYKNLERRLSSIEDTLKWLVRLIMGAIVMGALGILLSGGIPV